MILCQFCLMAYLINSYDIYQYIIASKLEEMYEGQQKTEEKETKQIDKSESKSMPIKKYNENKLIKHFTTEGLPGVIGKKIEGLVEVLNADVINLQKLKNYLSDGIPDEAGVIREYCWKVILGYLPEEKKLWESKMQKQVSTYEGFIEMFLPEATFPDYPIILKKEHPKFKELEEDFILWEQIQKDTSRTHAEFSFFAMPSKEIMIPYLTSARREKFRLINGEDEASYKEFLTSQEKQRKTYRYDYMSRILYIYSKLNPKIQYVQGMNQILAPIFYMVNVTKPPNSLVQEASCFFMFNNAISDVIQLHIKDLDKSQNGIFGKLNAVNQMLVVIEPRIWSRLQKLKIDPFFYCFRWITLLYAQDFALFDTLRIWQSIFSADNRLDYINFIAISIMISSKEVILNHDFTFVLEYLQNIKDNIRINDVINIANQLYLEFKGHDFCEHAKITKESLKKKDKKKEKGEGFIKKFNNLVDKYF